MKKQIPLSILLVSVSLIGFFIIQFSWIMNLMESSRQRTREHVTLATKEVTGAIANRLSITMRPVQKSPLQFPEDVNNIPRITTVRESFSLSEIEQMFRQALDKHSEKGLYTEFAIINNTFPSKYVSMSTPLFIQYALDSSLETKASKPIIENIGLNVEYGGISESMIVIIPNINKQVLRSQWLILLGFVFYTIITLAAFYLTVKTMLQQRDLSKIKSDFINNMTHEFKTPLATISLAVDALKNKKVMGSEEKLTYFTDIIREENKRMNKHVGTILKAAFSEKQELNVHLKAISAQEIIEQVVRSFDLQLKEKNEGTYELKFAASNDVILADTNHFTNLVNNLMDNAVKYSKTDIPAHVIVSTYSNNRYFTLKVQDNGIGMSKETVKRIFEKFYRAHTGNLHNVKGFGLGMNYVKSIVDSHKGKIKVESALEKGSIFTIDIPLAHPTNDL